MSVTLTNSGLFMSASYFWFSLQICNLVLSWAKRKLKGYLYDNGGVGYFCSVYIEARVISCNRIKTFLPNPGPNGKSTSFD